MAEAIFTREVLYEKIKKKKVPIKSNDKFREAIVSVLEEEFDIRDNLTEEQAAKFDHEVNDFHGNLPRWWRNQPINRNKHQLEIHHGSWLKHEITLSPLQADHVKKLTKGVNYSIIEESILVQSSQKKTILFWNSYWHWNHFKMGVGNRGFSKCPMKNW